MSDQPIPGISMALQASLKSEGKYLHQCLFRREAPAPLIINYLEVHAAMPELNEGAVAQQRTLDRIVEKKLDATAIEPWLRTKSRRHLLSSKLLLLAYLAECDGQHSEFQRQSRGRRRFVLDGGMAVFTALRGLLSKIRHGLV